MPEDDPFAGGINADAIKAFVETQLLAAKTAADGRVAASAASATAAEKVAEELKKKLAETEAVIAEQARQLAAAKELAKGEASKKKESDKTFVVYGEDGRGKDNTWPLRDLNDPQLSEPHHFDVSQDVHYQRCVGSFKSFSHEFRTLAAVGSYLHDLDRALAPVIKDIFDLGEETDKKLASSLKNSLFGIRDLVACRFGYVCEFTKPNADRHKLNFLYDKLYPHDAPLVPTSSIQEWSDEFEKRRMVSTEQQLAKASAAAGIKAGGATPGEQSVVPKPNRFQRNAKK